MLVPTSIGRRSVVIGPKCARRATPIGATLHDIGEAQQQRQSEGAGEVCGQPQVSFYFDAILRFGYFASTSRKRPAHPCVDRLVIHFTFGPELQQGWTKAWTTQLLSGLCGQSANIVRQQLP